MGEPARIVDVQDPNQQRPHRHQNDSWPAVIKKINTTIRGDDGISVVLNNVVQRQLKDWECENVNSIHDMTSSSLCRAFKKTRMIHINCSGEISGKHAH